MKTVWRNTIILLIVSLLILTAGFWMAGLAWSEAGSLQQLNAVKRALNDFGGERGIADRQKTLSEIRDQFKQELAAKRSDAVGFSRRVEEVFAQLHLVITASSGWQAIPEFTGKEAVAFKRTFSGFGAFGSLLNAIHTLENWPDRVRIRSLSVLPETAGRVSFTIEIATMRLARPEPEKEG